MFELFASHFIKGMRHLQEDNKADFPLQEWLHKTLMVEGFL